MNLTATALLALVAATQGVWSDPDKARAEDPDFILQGEYSNGKDGLQIVALGKGKFFAATLKGGIPGAGWDGKSLTYIRPGRDQVKSLIESGGWPLMPVVKYRSFKHVLPAGRASSTKT